MIIKNMNLSDLLLNYFYKFRFAFYQIFYKKRFKTISDPIKANKKLVFKDDFKYKSWGNNSENKKWLIGGHAPYHPDNLSSYYGPAKIVNINGKKYAELSVKYNPKTFPADTWYNTTGHPVTIPFEVTKLSTIDSFKQKYGRFEYRCTIPHDRGVWPAFWMWGSTWPPEIDVFELYGGKSGKTAGIQKINLHYGKVIDGTKKDMKAWGVRIEKKTKKLQFHEFVCEWSEGKIEMFTDGVKIFRYTRKDILDKWYNVDNANMWVVTNHGIQKDIITEKDKDFESKYYADYIRVYKNK